MFEEIERHKAEKSTPEAYPGGLERHVALKNGESILIRPIRPDDQPPLLEPDPPRSAGELPAHPGNNQNQKKGGQPPPPFGHPLASQPHPPASARLGAGRARKLFRM